MTIFVFGNPDLPEDSLPLRLLPRLKELFPEIDFQIKDPNEDWDIPEEMVVIDTVSGIKTVTVFDDLSVFENAPRISLHDFDLGSYLKYLAKLGKLKKIKIIGVPASPPGGPPMISEKQALEQIFGTLRRIV